MTKSKALDLPVKDKQAKAEDVPVSMGNGGEWHQAATGDLPVLTTNQGLPISDNQNSLMVNPKELTLLEDFILREKLPILTTNGFLNVLSVPVERALTVFSDRGCSF